jgi:hypothetical protein
MRLFTSGNVCVYAHVGMFVSMYKSVAVARRRVFVLVAGERKGSKEGWPCYIPVKIKVLRNR